MSSYKFGFEDLENGYFKCTRALSDGNECKIKVRDNSFSQLKMRRHDLVHQNKTSYKNLRKVSQSQCSKN